MEFKTFFFFFLNLNISLKWSTTYLFLSFSLCLENWKFRIKIVLSKFDQEGIILLVLPREWDFTTASNSQNPEIMVWFRGSLHSKDPLVDVLGKNDYSKTECHIGYSYKTQRKVEITVSLKSVVQSHCNMDKQAPNYILRRKISAHALWTHHLWLQGDINRWCVNLFQVRFRI